MRRVLKRNSMLMVRREKNEEMLKAANVTSMTYIQDLFKETIARFM